MDRISGESGDRGELTAEAEAEAGTDSGADSGDETSGLELVSRSRELGDVSFGAIVDAADEPRVQWSTPDGLEVVGRGVAVRIVATGPDRFEAVREQASRVFDRVDHDGPSVARPRAFGGFAFHDEHEPGVAPWTGFDAASFLIPRLLVVRSGDGTWLTAVAETESDAEDRLEDWNDRLADLPAMRPSGSGPGVDTTHRSTSPDEWADQVECALDRIDDGRLTKVVLAQALSVDLEDDLDVAATLERLRRRYPNCYRFLIGHEIGGTFFGAPPERLVAKRGDCVETEALAGSVPRGDTPEADEEYADELFDSDKVQREHGLVAEAIRAQLEPLTASLTTADQTVRKLATIQHLWTPIEATLEKERHVLELVEALHPTPAVGGVPTTAAWETIRETEAFDRGWYAAPVGWFDGNGDGEFAVGLRSGVAREDSITLFAGNGIVTDSDPDDEWTEVQLKLRSILDELR
ncbi:isochorismate synthase [Natronobacterium gregoryi]|uniref:isochorismate synthase n=2 Tax=Natronobacterium gregoryi TaxID=44930 RepID=L0ABT4_NATGS|nr:isochorismate synthase [Natronobacterium gregoryi]AFZ71331.1 isochorismate synthase family protein [Natronobacterium gregoryi SP2]ELY67033.1 isochorismate synthase [Natronobacterium gregoryi SP2]PLK18462.1 isochorismate synthase [Natronobacterium gregoryi SP2]SFJ70450.1 isochorismate synthase [Natronobacterium gregoryi]